jgi:hypothetical protein
MLDKLIKETKYIVAIFEDDEVLMNALKKGREINITAKDVFTPFPVHGIDDLLDIPRSRLGIVAFSMAMVGVGLALLMQIYMMHIDDWNLNIGGKPTLAIPSFIPITFEVAILFGSLSLALAYFIRCQLAPGYFPKIYDKRQTSDRFVAIFEEDGLDSKELQELLRANGATEVREEIVKESKLPIPLPIKHD